MSGFAREINRVVMVMFCAFGLIVVAATYYSVFARQPLMVREDNPRFVEAQQSVVRGSLYDRSNVRMAYTTLSNDGFAQRVYPRPSAYSAVGYYSYRYGTGGAEGAYNVPLSGTEIPPSLRQVVLDQPVEGIDVRLTVDVSMQRRILAAMDGRAGAVLVMTVPDGEILGLVSAPTVNPNTLDANWDRLVDSPGNPFFNRPLQGQYQPGGVMQLPVLVDAVSRGQPLTAQFPTGAAPVVMDDLELRCATVPAQMELTLRGAFLHGCPNPFAQSAPLLNVTSLQTTLDNLQLQAPPNLDGFVPEEDDRDVVTVTEDNIRENVLGQGDLNLSPLAINAVTAAVVNNGNTPIPNVLQATRAPAASEWQPEATYQASIAYMTSQTAQQIRALMRESAATGTASGAVWNELNVGGHAAVAYSGDGTLVWFTGFLILEQRPNVIVTVVLEDTDDINHALRVAREAMLAARFTLTLESNANPPTPQPTPVTQN